MPSSLPSIVTVGNCLTIEKERRYNGPDSEGGTGFVVCVHEDGTFDIKLTVGRVERRVHPSRILDSAPLATTARRLTLDDDSATRPSLLSPNHVPFSERASPVPFMANTSTIIAAAKTTTTPGRINFETSTIHHVIQQCNGWNPKYSNKPHPIMDMLEWGKRSKDKGWARYHDERVSGGNNIPAKPPKQLTPEQNLRLVNVKRETDRYSDLVNLAGERGVKGNGPIPLLEHAFDVGKTKVKKCIQKYNAKNGSMERKKRSDAGKTLVNSQQKRKQVCTGYSFFKKFKRQQHSGEELKTAELKQAYANLTEAERLQCAQGAEVQRTMLANIEAETKRVMQHTNGSITWERLAQQIAGGKKNVQPIGANALKRWDRRK
jgi:hypothetical protein